MTPEQKLGDLADLVFTRLDLPQVPEVDESALLEWIRDQRRAVLNEKRLHDEGAPDARYPWRAVYAFHRGVWDADFVRAFPSLVDYMAHFPTGEWLGICLLAQLPGESVFLHTDPDYGVGWRVYLNHGGPRLFFRRFRERYATRPETWSGGGPDAMARLCEGEPIYVEEQGRFPWALTSIRAAHGVEPSPGELGARVTILLIPNPQAVDHEAHRALLRRSAEKYARTAIWY